VQDFAKSGIVRGGILSWAQALGTHQHALQSFKNTFYSRNFRQWRSSGASEGTYPGAQTLGAHQHTFCSHFI